MSNLSEKWAPVLGHQDMPEIKDAYKAQVTAQLLENQEKFMASKLLWAWVVVS